MNTLEYIKKYKMIVIMRGVKIKNVIDTAKALYDGGIRLIEVTFNQSSTSCIEDTAKSIRMICEKYDDKICVGAGTVMTVEQVEKAVEAGAKYIISPNTDKRVIERTKQLGALSIPGAFTPTEIVIAHQYGADYVKLFPAGILGTKYIKAVKAPISHIKLMVVGGIDENNIGEFLSTRISGVGVSSSLVNLKLIEEKKYMQLTQLAKKFTKSIGENDE